MRRKKHYQVPRPTRRQVDLDGSLDTSGTQPKVADGRSGGAVYKQSENIPPPFKGEDGSGYLRKSELSLTWKVAGIVAAIFFSVGIPVIWFASGLSKDVDNLSEQVGGIERKTDKLLEGSIRSEIRLNNAEKAIDSIAQAMQNNQQKSHSKETSEDTSH